MQVRYSSHLQALKVDLLTVILISSTWVRYRKTEYDLEDSEY